MKVARKDHIDITSYRVMLFHKDFHGEQITGFFKQAVLPHKDVISLPDGSVSSENPLDAKTLILVSSTLNLRDRTL